MFGRKAVQLPQELILGDKETLPRFNNDLFDQVLQECSEHGVHLTNLLLKIQEAGLDLETTRNSDHYGAVIHHTALTRNKRCLLSYVYHRAKMIRSLRWKLGAVLPQDIQLNMTSSEKEHFKDYTNMLESYITDIDVELNVDMIPPKDPYVKVRVLDDIGNIFLDDQATSLTRNSVHLMKRTEAEPFVLKGLMEEFIE